MNTVKEEKGSKVDVERMAKEMRINVSGIKYTLEILDEDDTKILREIRETSLPEELREMLKQNLSTRERHAIFRRWDDLSEEAFEKASDLKEAKKAFKELRDKSDLWNPALLNWAKFTSSVEEIKEAYTESGIDDPPLRHQTEDRRTKEFILIKWIKLTTTKEELREVIKETHYVWRAEKAVIIKLSKFFIKK